MKFENFNETLILKTSYLKYNYKYRVNINT